MEDETPVLLPAAIPLHLGGLLLSGHHRPGPGPLRRLMEGVYTETARASCSILSLLPASWTCLSDSCLSACSLNLLCLLSSALGLGCCTQFSPNHKTLLSVPI